MCTCILKYQDGNLSRSHLCVTTETYTGIYFAQLDKICVLRWLRLSNLGCSQLQSGGDRLGEGLGGDWPAELNRRMIACNIWMADWLFDQLYRLLFECKLISRSGPQETIISTTGAKLFSLQPWRLCCPTEIEHLWANWCPDTAQLRTFCTVSRLLSIAIPATVPRRMLHISMCLIHLFAYGVGSPTVTWRKLTPFQLVTNVWHQYK